MEFALSFQRVKTHCSYPKPQNKVSGLGNQEDGHDKRTPSSPQRGDKKRSAFVDLTNAGAPVKSSEPGQKAQTNKVVKTKSKCPFSEELSKNAEVPVEGSRSDIGSLGRAVEPSLGCAVQDQKVPEAFNIDEEQAGDYLMCPDYAKDIFDYLKNREEDFVLTDYMHNQPDIDGDMRGILVDWMVAVQENFKLSHEVLYLAVKLTDHYLSEKVTMVESLQLVGSTAMLIASKFEKRHLTCIDDFMYICDDTYTRQEFIVMERNILQGLNFEINIPVPYRFLRRYAKVAYASMETLTLARYVCELSLLELELVPERASLLASACLLLAFIIKGMGGWTAALQYHSGYALCDLKFLVRKLYAMMASPTDDQLRAVKIKYSHKAFFEVAKIPLAPIKMVELALCK